MDTCCNKKQSRISPEIFAIRRPRRPRNVVAELLLLLSLLFYALVRHSQDLDYYAIILNGVRGHDVLLQACIVLEN